MNIPQDICDHFGIIQDEIMLVEDEEISLLLHSLKIAIDTGNYVFSSREKNDELEYTYQVDEQWRLDVLRELSLDNFSTKVKDTSAGAYKRQVKGYEPEALYIFKCKRELKLRDSSSNEVSKKEVKLYIKINNRKKPTPIMIIVSFHEGR